MSDQAAAAEKYVEQYEATMTLGWGDDTAYAFAKAVVALSARLAQAPRVLHDGEVCGCFDETGKRTVRLYERCERCGAFNG